MKLFSMLVMHFRCQKGMIKSVKPRKLIEEKPWGLWDSYSLSHPFFQVNWDPSGSVVMA